MSNFRFFEHHRCLVKNPEERATASELLQNQFIRGAQPSSILRNMLEEAMEIRENQNSNRQMQIKNITDSVSLFIHFFVL